MEEEKDTAYCFSAFVLLLYNWTAHSMRTAREATRAFQITKLSTGRRNANAAADDRATRRRIGGADYGAAAAGRTV